MGGRGMGGGLRVRRGKGDQSVSFWSLLLLEQLNISISQTHYF